MTAYKFLICVFLLSIFGCHAESREQPKGGSLVLDPAVGIALTSFSDLVTTHNAKAFVELAKPSGIYVVRQFTSGNLGSRGSEFGAVVSPLLINEKLELPIENQTAFNIEILFSGLPIKSIDAISIYTLPTELEQLPFEHWGAILNKDLLGKPEVDKGDALILHTTTARYWVYAEAQIIDGILVGGFAVFIIENNKPLLVAIIEYL
ncbi:MAG: hypothetical protein U5M23_08340 [Marinagarivorans sp.]|nr:hypothetical protein [Marinagarivorans sp.]